MSRATSPIVDICMQTRDLVRHQLIRNLTAQRTENAADRAVDLWAPVAVQLISIIGKGGFDSLYARSVFLTQSSYPWLASSTGTPRTANPFADLKTSLDGQAPKVVSEANCLLLITFTDILASLLGEHLTSRILASAWGLNAQESARKESSHD